MEAVEVKLKGCSFVPFIEFYGETEKDSDGSKKGKKSVPNYLRRAIQAEKDRQALPVVETEWLFALLDMADILHLLPVFHHFLILTSVGRISTAS